MDQESKQQELRAYCPKYILYILWMSTMLVGHEYLLMYVSYKVSSHVETSYLVHP